MDLEELKKVFINTDFFYYNNYLGVIKHIDYDTRGFYILYFYNNPDIKIIPYSYMLQCYINVLKNTRFRILRCRKISRLVHFTHLNNLESILRYGIVSRNFLDSFQIGYQYSDSIRLDGKLDFISNSISFPNYKMFYSKRMENPDTSWVVLSIDSSVLIDRFDTEFYRTNCASSSILKCRYNPTSNEALEDMFYLSDRDPQIPSNFTTDPQAEVMIKDKIDTSYINCIDTLSMNEKVYSLALNSHINYNPKSNLFNPRKDYRRW